MTNKTIDNTGLELDKLRYDVIKEALKLFFVAKDMPDAEYNIIHRNIVCTPDAVGNCTYSFAHVPFLRINATKPIIARHTNSSEGLHHKATLILPLEYELLFDSIKT